MRFVILEHHDPSVDRHFDLLLETGRGSLRAWRIARPPDIVRQSALELDPHRKVYLQYQGPVYPGRGWVKRWDEGRYQSLVETSNLNRIQVWGNQLRATIELVGNVGLTPEEWTCQVTAWRPKK